MLPPTSANLNEAPGRVGFCAKDQLDDVEEQFG